ncbi:MAG: TetR/AcrR family transcriptional regulator [Anaerolineales bacterium]|nr:TetR/AcrR family transcriptional regulator [Anaerolineales bacterium]
MPKGVPLTEEEQQRRRKEIFDASVHLFLDKGFNETTLREIAKAAGIGKSTLYDYFTSKDEILVSYFENEIQKITERAQEIARQELDISEKLRRIMQMHLEYLVDNKNFYLKLTIASQTLPLGSQEKIQAKRHAYQDMLRALIEDGIRREELRPINPLLAARSVFNLLATAVFTSRPTGTPEEMLEDAFDIFFNGIQA